MAYEGLKKRSAPSINHVILSGNLTRDAKATAKGCHFTVAISNYSKNKETGEVKTFTVYRLIWVKAPLSDSICKFLTKGKPVIVEGRMDSWPAKEEGKHDTEIVTADKVILLNAQEAFRDGAGPGAAKEDAPYVAETMRPIQDMGADDMDIPF